MASVAAASSAKDRLRACDYPEAGGKVQYTIPSFPVFTTSLVEIKYQLVDDSTVVFDGYIRDCPELVRSYPALLKLYSGLTLKSLIVLTKFSVIIWCLLFGVYWRKYSLA